MCSKLELKLFVHYSLFKLYIRLALFLGNTWVNGLASSLEVMHRKISTHKKESEISSSCTVVLGNKHHLSHTFPGFTETVLKQNWARNSPYAVDEHEVLPKKKGPHHDQKWFRSGEYDRD